MSNHPEPRPAFQKDRLTIICDLDETIWSSYAIPQMYGQTYGFTIRPRAQVFLKHMLKLSEQERIQFMFWTASTDDYAKLGMKELARVTDTDLSVVPLWTRRRCSAKINPETYHRSYRKQLNRIGVKMEHILLIDDRLTCPMQNPRLPIGRPC